MKRAFLILIAAGMPSLPAQESPSKPAKVDYATAFAITPPDENSPFFLDPDAAAGARGADYVGRDPNDDVAEYPKNRNSPDSVASQVKQFFGTMFASVNLGPIKPQPTAQVLTVEPERFSLSDRREIAVTYSIRNNTKKMTRLEYPTSQRIDIVTVDPDGKVIDRWSDDRAFQPEEGIVVINPKERIEYQEKIPTREMKAGQAYRVDVSTTSTEKFSAQKTVNPE